MRASKSVVLARVITQIIDDRNPHILYTTNFVESRTIPNILQSIDFWSNKLENLGLILVLKIRYIACSTYYFAEFKIESGNGSKYVLRKIIAC